MFVDFKRSSGFSILHITLSISENLILSNKSANFTHVFARKSSHIEDHFSPGESCARWREGSGCCGALWPTFVVLWRRQRTDWLVRGSFSSNVWFKCYIVMKLNMIDGICWSRCTADSYCGECGRVTACRRRRRRGGGWGPRGPQGPNIWIADSIYSDNTMKTVWNMSRIWNRKIWI